MTAHPAATQRCVIAKRRTFDGVHIALWSDGTLTSRFSSVQGLPYAKPRASAAALALRAAWMFLGEVELYDLDEVARLYEACRWACERGLEPADARKRFARSRMPAASWQVYHADAKGRPTLRVWKLPRIRWAGLAVWDRCTGGRGGRYELVSYDRKAVCSTSGLRFPTLQALHAHLAEVAS